MSNTSPGVKISVIAKWAEERLACLCSAGKAIPSPSCQFLYLQIPLHINSLIFAPSTPPSPGPPPPCFCSHPPIPRALIPYSLPFIIHGFNSEVWGRTSHKKTFFWASPKKGGGPLSPIFWDTFFNISPKKIMYLDLNINFRGQS